MSASAASRRSWTFTRLVLLVGLAAAQAATAQSVGVRISIRISAPSPEALSAWRRANGLDPPDAAADAKWRADMAAASGADAARERRRQRTVELVPVEDIAAGLADGSCTRLPNVTDRCTRVLVYEAGDTVVPITGR